MSTSLSKILQIVQYGLLGISALLGIIFLTGGISEDVIIYWCYALLIVAAVAALGFAIVNMISNPKGAKTSLIGLVALGVIFLVAYGIGGDEVLQEYKGISGAAASKRVSMGLITFYILGAGAIATAIFSEISRAFK